MVDKLEELAREGAQRLLAEMLEVEVTEFLQRLRYQRSQTFRGYRNGFAPERTIGVGMGAVTVRVPRVRDIPIESIFAGIRLRTNVGHPNRENGLYLVFKLVERLSQNWRRITGSNLCQLVLEGGRFIDGKLAEVVAA